MRRFRTLSVRMTINQVLVAGLASAIATGALTLLVFQATTMITPHDYGIYAMYMGMQWLFNLPDGQPNPENSNVAPGFSLLVSADHVVLHSQGDTACRAGMRLAECAPELLDSQIGERAFAVGDQQWFEIVMPTQLGQRAITRRGPPSVAPCFVLGRVQTCNAFNFAVLTIGAMTIFSLPVALLLAWLSARPLARRLSVIAQISQRFAAGDFAARVQDRHRDEIGEVARKVDDMADTLAHNVSALRDLAQRNAELAQQAENAAIQAERARISRDLHDAIAQRLFSLSASTSTLPDLIGKNADEGIAQARLIAELSEQTLLDLRTLLIELRPNNLIQRGLSDALRKVCEEWQGLHHIAVDCGIVLSGRRLPANIEDTVYRVTQEGLSNIAKHAEASEASVSVIEGSQQLILSISDNGLGFEVGAARNGKFGLISMQERAQALGGQVSIESEVGHGTTLHMTLPLSAYGGGKATS
jgi:two-component system, NarL family, sensor histidine kinase LiaS